MASSVLTRPPDLIERPDVTVMERSTLDDLDHIQALWASFEDLVGLHGPADVRLRGHPRRHGLTCTR